MTQSAQHRKALGPGQWLTLVAAFLGWMFDGLEMGLFPIVARPALQDLLHASDDAVVGLWNGRVVAGFLLGAAGGGLIFGWLGDRIGRVRAMALSILVYSTFTGAGYFASAAWHLGALRVCAALGMGGEWALGVALVMECWPDRLRPMLAGIIGAASNIGFLLISLVAMRFAVTVGSWRWMMLAGAAPGVLAFLVILLVPESQPWTASAGRASMSPIREILRPPLLRRTILAILLASVALIGTWGAVSGFLPVWADRLAGGHNPQAKAQVEFVVAIGAIAGCLLGAGLGQKVGRRRAYFLLCLASLLACGVLYRGLLEFNATFLIAAGVVGMTTAAFYGWLPLYLPELFPTRVRATGQGLGFNFGRILAAVGAVEAGQFVQFFEGAHPGQGYAQSGAVITLVYLLGMAIIWFAPETKGRPLPE
jgi:MFS family permease